MSIKYSPDVKNSIDDFGCVAIFMAGMATLFLELTFIRYIPGQVRVLGYFTNFVLLGAFLGFGLGILINRKWPLANWISFCTPLGFSLIVVLTAIGSLLNVIPPPEEFLFLEYSTSRNTMPIIPFLTISFIVIAGGFIPMGHFVGQTLKGPSPLKRYGINILGSLLGILVFIFLSAIGAKPWAWMMLAGVISFVGLWRATRVWQIIGIIAISLMVLIAGDSTRDAIWSPYQKISVTSVKYLPGRGMIEEWNLSRLTPKGKKEIIEMKPQEGFVILVNDDSYQMPLDLSDNALVKYPELNKMRIQFEMPFHLWTESKGRLSVNQSKDIKIAPPTNVLILGAGSGNDVAAALRAGAKNVDAVEIDPEILRLGQERHPEKPYSDLRVKVHLDDARNFLAATNKKYDMIVFGMIDSHVLLSHKSNIRLDSFVFTRESFSLARQKLKQDGILVVSHAVGSDFFYNRMRATLASVFEKPPIISRDIMYHPHGISYVTGENILPGRPIHNPEKIVILEDDWPFVYLVGKNIPKDYIIAMLLMAFISLISVYSVSSRKEGINLHFFSLGAAFLLLETRGISTLMILAGSTWGVSAAVFSGVLIMGLLATIWGYRIRESVSTRIPWEYYILLFGFLLLNYFIPVSYLVGFSKPVRVILGALMLSLPLFASGVVFASSLSRIGNADQVLAANLLGALVGGLVEYVSMATGFRYLLIMAAMFYLLAIIMDMRDRTGKVQSDL